MEHASSQQRLPAAAEAVRSPWILASAGLVLFHLVWHVQSEEMNFWLPGLGLGIALVSWLPWWMLPLLTADLLLVRVLNHGDQPWSLVLIDPLLHAAQIGVSWWVYYRVAGCSRWLDDPHSATLFLIFVPGSLAALAAIVQGVLWHYLLIPEAPLSILIAKLWLSRMVGILVILPLLLIMATPVLLRLHLINVELPTSFFGESLAALPRHGEWIELIGLTFVSSVLALLLLAAQANNDSVHQWPLWGCCLVLIVWICIRQGLRGGCFAAGLTSMVLLAAAQLFAVEVQEAIKSPLQGNLLAFCSTALLVGVSSSWVRANEARYRHVVTRIPVVLYSARLFQGMPTLVNAGQPVRARDSKRDMNVGPAISKMATVMLVSPASKEILGRDAETLLGPFSLWLEQIVAEDHELLIAALAQLCLQKQPVTCEYRVRLKVPQPLNDPALPATRSNQFQLFRWVRDTLTPHYSEDGLVDGWEGLVEEITEQRALSQNLRKMTNMLQVLITNLPTGVFFVQAPTGMPILVNARARQLLGQREDMSAGLAHLSRVYRLFRPDGKEYPSEELPISKALLLGATCRANDIVVHRSDGRKIPLIAWAAPIDLHGTGVPDAAVWVLEDLSAMQQAETALRESEVRLRAVIETMGEGVIVQDVTGTIIECNPAACAILDTPREQLLNRPALLPPNGCVQENGEPLASAEHPDQRALRDSMPVRGVILGLPIKPAGSLRWLLLNAMPLPVGPSGGLNYQKARVVTTFADITEQLHFQDSLRHAKEKYQNLVETLPFMMIQQDQRLNITYLNPAAVQVTGYPQEELLTPGFFQQIILPADAPHYQAAAERIAQGKSARVELRLAAKDGGTKYLLAFVHPQRHQGQVIGSTSVVIDITTQRRLEEELQRAKHLELVGKLASGTVHDFNNLLAVMLSLAELAKMEVSADHAVQSHLNRLVDAGEQASHLAGQILAFGKQRSRAQHAVDLNTIVLQTIKLLKSVIPDKIVIETVLQPALPLVTGNDNQLKQVMMNLCLNARDAMPGGGRLIIRTDSASSPEGNSPERDAKKWVHLSIQDTGAGMEESVSARIFEPFFSTKEHGTGLGLAVVQQVIKDCGGHIAVWSQPNAGTRIDVWLVQARGES